MTVADWLRQPGRGRYSHRETEHRFLLAGVPAEAGPPRLIDDLYLAGTTLRLRRVTDGKQTVLKLTQKVRLDEGDPTSVAITNLYLSGDEHRRLSTLDGVRLTKHRRPWLRDGRTWVVDEFAERWSGLVLAELETEDPVDIAVDPVLLADVTRDERFTGGALAAADDATVTAVLAAVRDLSGSA